MSGNLSTEAKIDIGLAKQAAKDAVITRLKELGFSPGSIFGKDCVAHGLTATYINLDTFSKTKKYIQAIRDIQHGKVKDEDKTALATIFDKLQVDSKAFAKYFEDSWQSSGSEATGSIIKEKFPDFEVFPFIHAVRHELQKAAAIAVRKAIWPEYEAAEIAIKSKMAEWGIEENCTYDDGRQRHSSLYDHFLNNSYGAVVSAIQFLEDPREQLKEHGRMQFDKFCRNIDEPDFLKNPHFMKMYLHAHEKEYAESGNEGLFERMDNYLGKMQCALPDKNSYKIQDEMLKILKHEGAVAAWDILQLPKISKDTPPNEIKEIKVAIGNSGHVSGFPIDPKSLGRDEKSPDVPER